MNRVGSGYYVASSGVEMSDRNEQFQDISDVLCRANLLNSSVRLHARLDFEPGVIVSIVSSTASGERRVYSFDGQDWTPANCVSKLRQACREVEDATCKS